MLDLWFTRNIYICWRYFGAACVVSRDARLAAVRASIARSVKPGARVNEYFTKYIYMNLRVRVCVSACVWVA